MNVAVVPLPDDKVPVEEILTVLPAPVKLVTILLLTSLAVILIVKGVPDVCVPILPPVEASTKKLFKVPGVKVTVVVLAAVTLLIVKPMVDVPDTVPLVKVAV